MADPDPQSPWANLGETIRSKYEQVKSEPWVQDTVSRAKPVFNNMFPGLLPAKPTATPPPAATTPAATAPVPPAAGTPTPDYDWVSNFTPSMRSVAGIGALEESPATLAGAKAANLSPQDYLNQRVPALLAAKRQEIMKLQDPAARRAADLQLRAAELNYLRSGTDAAKAYGSKIDHEAYNKAMGYTPEEMANLPGAVAGKITGWGAPDDGVNRQVGKLLTFATNQAAKGEADKAVASLQQIAQAKPIESGFGDWAAKWAPAIAMGIGGLLMMFGNTPGRLVGALAMLGGAASATARVRNLALPENRAAIADVLKQPELLQDDATLQKTYNPQQYAAIKDFQFAASFEWGRQFLEKQAYGQAQSWQNGYWPVAPQPQNKPQ